MKYKTYMYWSWQQSLTGKKKIFFFWNFVSQSQNWSITATNQQTNQQTSNRNNDNSDDDNDNDDSSGNDDSDVLNEETREDWHRVAKNRD